jgi:hypothetical protein
MANHSLILLALSVLTPVLASAHHDALSQFDTKTFIELEGEVADVLWAYPHVTISIIVIEKQGPETWTLQTQDPAVLRQLGISKNPLGVGDIVRVYGWAPRRKDERGSFIFNLLLPTGEELVLERGGERRLSR